MECFRRGPFGLVKSKTESILEPFDDCPGYTDGQGTSPTTRGDVSSTILPGTTTATTVTTVVVIV